MIGIDCFEDYIDDGRYDEFVEEAKAHDNRLRLLKAQAEEAEKDAYEALAKGELKVAEANVKKSHARATAAQAEGREIEGLARSIMRADQDSTSKYIGKIAPTPGRRAFLALQRNPEMPTQEQQPFLDIICMSPDGAPWAVLVSERILRRPFKEAHGIIATSTQWSFHYSMVIDGRFEEGEDAVRRSRKLWNRYRTRHGLSSSAQSCEACGGRLRNGTCDNHGPRTAGATS